MEKQPTFIREHSKSQHQEARNERAAEIKAKRKEHFDAVRSAETAEAERQGEVQSRAQELRDLAQRILEIKKNLPSKLRYYFEIKSLEAQLDIKTAENDEFSSTSLPIEAPDDHGLQEARDLLSDFHVQMEQDWKESEFTEEEVAKYFTEENLANLSMDDYVFLLQRFPKYMVTHVTRQGVRDHTGHEYHTKGVGEMSRGFENIVAEGRLKSALSMMMAEGKVNDALLEEFCDYDTREEALANLESYLAPSSQGSRQTEGGTYADTNAVHFASESVGNTYYGSENGNEIFLVFPSALVVNEYGFSGNMEHDKVEKGNDVYIWPKEQEGLDVNAGIMFIPKSTEVGSDSGSRYRLDEKGEPVRNTDNLQAVKELALNPVFRSYILELQSKEVTDYYPYVVGAREENASKAAIFEEDVRRTLVESFGVSAVLAKALSMLNFHGLFVEEIYSDYGTATTFGTADFDEEYFDGAAEHILRSVNLLYEKPADTCTAEEYWTKYMAEHPTGGQRKVVFYDGDPTQALLKWRNDHGIVKESPGFLVLQSNQLEHKPMETTGLRGSDRFKPLIEEIINNHFDEMEKDAA